MAALQASQENKTYERDEHTQRESEKDQRDNKIAVCEGEIKTGEKRGAQRVAHCILVLTEVSDMVYDI